MRREGKRKRRKKSENKKTTYLSHGCVFALGSAILFWTVPASTIGSRRYVGLSRAPVRLTSTYATCNMHETRRRHNDDDDGDDDGDEDEDDGRGETGCGGGGGGRRA